MTRRRSTRTTRSNTGSASKKCSSARSGGAGAQAFVRPDFFLPTAAVFRLGEDGCLAANGVLALDVSPLLVQAFDGNGLCRAQLLSKE